MSNDSGCHVIFCRKESFILHALMVLRGFYILLSAIFWSISNSCNKETQVYSQLTADKLLLLQKIISLCSWMKIFSYHRSLFIFFSRASGSHFQVFCTAFHIICRALGGGWVKMYFLQTWIHDVSWWHPFWHYVYPSAPSLVSAKKWNLIHVIWDITHRPGSCGHVYRAHHPFLPPEATVCWDLVFPAFDKWRVD